MKKNNKKAFSIIEILIGMVIFLIGISAIYSTIVSTLNLNESNKNYIIGVNLAREQLELFRNIRDTNFVKQRGFSNTSDAECSNDCKKFEKGKIYKISNDFSGGGNFTVKTEEGRNISKPYKIDDLKEFQVCIFEITDSGKKYNLYDYCDKNLSSTKKELRIYKFIEISQVKNYEMNGVSKDGKIDEKDALKVTSKVIWYTKRWQEFEVSSIFTNYKN